MAQERLSMRKIKEILRLKYDCGLSHRQIAASCQMSSSTVSEYVQRATSAGVAWPLAEGLTDEALEAKLFPAAISTQFHSVNKPLPDFARVHEELRTHQKVNLTLDLLWREYKEQYPDGYQYSHFCRLYYRWRQTLDLPMRQAHKAGDKVFVDYGEGLCLTNPTTGEFISTELFVAVWGLSNFTFAEATLTQSLPDWISSHVRAFTYFGCVPHILVPDNLKSGITQACYYEPEINPTYADLASHYGVAVLPARPRHPRDKAKVEAGVLIAKRWILAALRHRTFYSLEEMNKAIRELLEQLNARLLRKMKKSRRQLFDELDHPAAKTLVGEPYQLADWKKATVNIDYHIEADKHYYSVPYQYVHQKVEVRLTPATVEIFCKGTRIAAHGRSFVPHKHTTTTDHMPAAHQEQGRWNPERILKWAETIGPCVVLLLKEIMAHRDHPEQGYRACLGVMRLGKSYSKERMEAAALRAIQYKAFSFRSVKSILFRGLDGQSSPSSPRKLPKGHDNLRGPGYYH
jgi:transposase